MTAQKTISGGIAITNSIQSTNEITARFTSYSIGEILSLQYKDVSISVNYEDIVKLVFEARNKI